MLLQGFVIIFSFTMAGGQYNKPKTPAKGFYCKDPDTGKLYPVNTTWMSTTFCGSYTCKIKKKDDSDKSLIPEITALDKNQPLEVDYMNKVEKRKHNNVLQGDKAMELHSILHAIQNKSVDSETGIISDKIDETDTANVDKDRLLSEDEIISMTTLLKSMKVSELDAVLQVLHLAHDLYSDIDKVVIHDESNEFKSPDTKFNAQATYKDGDIVSYWYEPLTITNNKVKADPISFLKKSNENKITQEAPLESKDTPVGNSKYNFKIKPLLHEDSDMLTKLLKFTSTQPKNVVFYDPTTAFQRQSSYMHNPSMSYRHPKPTSLVPQLPHLFQIPAVKPKPNFALQESPYPEKCWKKVEAPIDKKLHLLPWLTSKGLPNNKVKLDDFTLIPHAIVPQSSVQLPLQYLGEITEDISPLSLLTVSNKAYQGSLNSPYVAQSSNSIIEDREQSFNNIQRLKESSPLLSPVGISEGSASPGWVSGSAGVPVFNDIKSPEEAIASGNLLPFPFRKNTNIKKMPYTGEEKIRKKRDEVPKGDVNSEEFEVYLEKSTCQTDIEPGFFRMGDSTQPFPSCCPQRIGNEHTEDSLKT